MSAELIRTEVEVRGIRVSVLERPASEVSSKFPIVMLHGLVAEAATFKRLIRELPHDRRVVAIDVPGAGYSDNPYDASFSGLAGLVGAVLRELAVHDAILLGHSYGGVIALQMAVSQPQLLRGLILISPAHPFSGKEDALVRFYLSPPGRVFAHCLPLLPRPLLLFAYRHMPGKRTEFGYEDIDPYVHTLRRMGLVQHVLGLLRTWRDDMRTLQGEMAQRQVQIFTLLIWGERDIVVPLSTATKLMQYLERPSLVSLHKVGHVANEEAPVETALAIRSWLEEHGL